MQGVEIGPRRKRRQLTRLQLPAGLLDNVIPHQLTGQKPQIVFVVQYTNVAEHFRVNEDLSCSFCCYEKKNAETCLQG